jgi:hypothetical protein
MATGFPALMIKPPESPIQQMAGAQQIQAGQQEAQMRTLQIQQEQQQLTDQHAITQAMLNWDGKDPNSLAMGVLRNGGSGSAVFGVTQKLLATRQTTSEIAKNDAITAQNTADTLAKQNDEYRGRVLNIAGMKDPAAQQAAWDSEVTKEEQAGTIKPGAMSHTYPGNEQAIVLANNFALGSQLVKEAQEKQKLALEAWKPVAGGLTNAVTGEKISGLDPSNIPLLNNGLKARWQVLHPGEEPPDYFQLKPGANPTDFERMDKLLQSTEEASRAKLTHEDAEKQLAVSNGIRAQMFDFQIDKVGLKPVQGTDPKTGRTVVVPYSQAQQMGVKDAAEIPSQDYQKALSGRQWLMLANKQGPAGAEPKDMGITQLIDKMDKKDKLGPLAGRWNEFMTGTWGAGDADYAALKAKMDLSSTLLGAVHTGRLGPYLLENLHDLAQAKKMDGPTLKSAFGAEVNYVTDVARDPNPPDWSKGSAPLTKFQAPAGAPAAPKEDGHILRMNGKDVAKSKGGEWVAP